MPSHTKDTAVAVTQAASFLDYQAQTPSARFSDWLVLQVGSDWAAATEHEFTKAIGDDTMPAPAYVRYLIEDYTFITDLASTLGYLVAKAPTMRSKARLSAFLALLTSEENDYFERSFAALNASEATYRAAAQGPVTRQFSNLLLTSSGKGTYAEGLACLLCAEWVYLTWGLREAKKPRPEAFYLAEWIDLHAVPGFESFVGWLREEMDVVGNALSETERQRVAQCFKDMCALEVAFFDAVWEGS